jgi:putative tryptophan/tyrosine transport system substrate-binding protein
MALPLVGILSATEETNAFVMAFLNRMEELGWDEDATPPTVHYEKRWAGGDFRKLVDAAQDLADAQVDVIFAGSTPAIRAARKATSKIPIVMGVTGHPRLAGGIVNPNKPGGNVTGMSDHYEPQSERQVKWLIDAVGGGGPYRFAVLFNPENPGKEPDKRAIKRAAKKLTGNALPGNSGYVEIIELPIKQGNNDTATKNNIWDAFRLTVRLATAPCQGVLILGDPVLGLPGVRHLIRNLTYNDNGLDPKINADDTAGPGASNAIKAMYGATESVESGGLMSYGPSHKQVMRQAAEYVDWILRGSEPSVLPVGVASGMEYVLSDDGISLVWPGAVPAAVLDDKPKRVSGWQKTLKGWRRSGGGWEPST